MTSGRVYVWKTPKEACIPECLVPTVRSGDGSVTIWAAISWYSIGHIITLKGRLTIILGKQCVLWSRCCFLTGKQFFKLPQSEELSWFEEHEDALQHLPWTEQSPELNTIKPLVRFRE